MSSSSLRLQFFLLEAEGELESQSAYNQVMATKLRIFYAWQSDTPGKPNHYFIREACEEAIRKLNADAQIEEDSFELDHDTKGVSGSPPIAETICRKIDECSIFIGDVTTVGEYARAADDKPRKTQNANVLIELGYARKTKGSERLVLVMNSVYGSPEDLPFDLRHLRHPLQYNLSDPKDPQFKNKRKALADDLAVAIKAVNDGILAEEGTQQGSVIDSVTARAEEDRTKFESSVVTGGFHGFDGVNGILTFCLIPLTAPAQPLDLATDGDVLGQKFRPMHSRFKTTEHHQHSIVIFDPGYTPSGQLGRKTMVELTAVGGLLAAAELPKKPVPPGGPKDAIGFIPFHDYEGELFERLRSYLQTLHSYGVQGPYYFGLTLQRIKDMILAPVNAAYDARQVRPLRVEKVRAAAVLLDGKPSYDDRKAMGLAIQPAMDELWRAAGCHMIPI